MVAGTSQLVMVSSRVFLMQATNTLAKLNQEEVMFSEPLPQCPKESLIHSRVAPNLTSLIVLVASRHHNVITMVSVDMLNVLLITAMVEQM